MRVLCLLMALTAFAFAQEEKSPILVVDTRVPDEQILVLENAILENMVPGGSQDAIEATINGDNKVFLYHTVQIQNSSSGSEDDSITTNHYFTIHEINSRKLFGMNNENYKTIQMDINEGLELSEGCRIGLNIRDVTTSLYMTVSRTEDENKGIGELVKECTERINEVLAKASSQHILMNVDVLNNRLGELINLEGSLKPKFEELEKNDKDIALELLGLIKSTGELTGVVSSLNEQVLVNSKRNVQDIQRLEGKIDSLSTQIEAQDKIIKAQQDYIEKLQGSWKIQKAINK
jgi:hypothetical protein